MVNTPSPRVFCSTLSTTFVGVQHCLSTPEIPIYQFRGIKYANVPARFRRSRPHSAYQRITDATKDGPIAPQPKQRCIEESLFGLQADQILAQNSIVQDEFECLNLTVTTPGSPISESLLPVMVWVHGGDNVQGRGSSWITDAGKLVGKSMELNRPVIMVAMNYRLGLLGFGASHALAEDNHSAGDDGVGNYGLYDQLNALKWIQNHITSFGGDPSEITLFGESTGAIDIHSILLSKINQMQNIATRAIIQSGVISPVIVPSVACHDSLLSRVMTHLNVRTVGELRSVDVDLLVAHTPSTMNATDDGVFFRDDWKKSSSPDGIQSLIIGDCMFESALWEAPISLWTTSSLVRRVRAIIRGVYKADAFLRTYGITCHSYDEDTRESVLNIVNDAHFAWPTERTVQNTRNSLDVYRYVFDQESPLNGVAHHGVDLIYLFDNVPSGARCQKAVTYNDSDADSDDDDDYFALSDLSYNVSRVRKAMQERWIVFANGEKPWSQEKVYVFGPEGEIGERCMEELGRRRRLEEFQALDTLPPEVVQKIASELIRGPRVAPKTIF